MPAEPKLTIKGNSSLEGWGYLIDNSSISANGRWSYEEKGHHIKYLENKAIFLGLMSRCSELKHCSIKVLCDNQTAVSYLRNMGVGGGGTHSRDCNDITRQTILWCKERDITLTITHLPGILDTEANRASSVFHDHTEWSLDDKVFQSLALRWGQPDTDLFASPLNAKLPCYVAWQPDPKTLAVDAFTLDWSKYNLLYCFPPFSVIARVLQKILQSQATAILVLPDWATQFWYPRMTSMLVAPPVKMTVQKRTLTLPHDITKVHPLYPKLQLIGCLVSGKPSSLRE